MNKNKIKKLFTMAIMSGTLMIGLHNTAYAVITDYAVKLNNEIYSYNRTQLEQSFLDYKSGESAKLYEDFNSKLVDSKGFYAFKDDKKGYVSYEYIEDEFLKSKDNNKSFNVEEFIEEEKYESIGIKSLKEISVDDKGSVLIKEKEEKKEDVKPVVPDVKPSPVQKKEEVKRKKKKDKPIVPEVKPVPVEKKPEVKEEVKKEEAKKEDKPIVPEVKPVPVEKKPEVKEEVKKEEAKKEDKPIVPEVKPVPVEKKPEVKEEVKKEVKKEDKQIVPEVKPAPVEKKPEVKKEEKKETTNSMESGFEAQIKDGNRRDIKEAKKPAAIASKTKGNLSINSEITQTSQIQYMANYQETTILLQGVATEDMTLELVGKTVSIKKGDSYSTVLEKIYNKFQDNEDWNVRYKYGQWGRMGNITFKSKKFREHVDINIKNQNGLVFKVKNEEFGETAISERLETCTATILNNSINDEKIKIEVKSSVMNKTFVTVELEIKKGETKEKIAEKIVNKLKTDEMIKRCFKVSNKGEQVILIQNQPAVLNLSVTVA